MWRPSVATMVVVVVVLVVVMTGVEGSSALPGLSWCSESKTDGMRITKTMKPELSQIGVWLNDVYELDMVDEVIIRQQAPCEGITQEEIAHINREEAKIILHADGNFSLLWQPPDTLPIHQEIDNFCITTNRDNPDEAFVTFLAKFCFPNASLQAEEEIISCSEVACVRKCCPEGMSLIGRSMCGAVHDGEDWQPDIAAHMLYGPPRLCVGALIYYNFSLLPSGMILVGDELKVQVDGYCIENIGNPSQTVALGCQREVTAWHCEWRHEVLNPVLQGISAVCLLIVWVVYICVARLRKLNESCCIISLVSALFIAYVNFIILGQARNPSLLCEVAGRLAHLGFLASYFWMNVLSFHTFVQLRSPMDGKWEKPSMFVLYCLYAWGVPLAVAVLGVVLDYVQADAIRPYFNTCWFQDSAGYWAYMYGPMLLLMTINVGFFVGTVVLLSRGRGRVTFTPSSGQHHTYSAWLYVRLFILTGILWVTEVVSWYFLSYCTIPEWTVDILNSLQGVLVFLVTICCRRDLKVFHCGRPQLIQKGRHGEVSTTEASEMAANPLVS